MTPAAEPAASAPAEAAPAAAAAPAGGGGDAAGGGAAPAADSAAPAAGAAAATAAPAAAGGDAAAGAAGGAAAPGADAAAAPGDAAGAEAAPPEEEAPETEAEAPDAGADPDAAAAAEPAAEAPVQAKAAGGAEDPAQVQEAAASGVSGSGGTMPHGDAIQRSFGKHDISGVKAHTDDKAAAATGAMGAEAYATGNDVAFGGGGAPSLHTAAHEAAHTIQQKGGVQLAGGVGAVGDAYEQHADAVADKVVAGESAEGLLDAGPGGSAGGGAAGVQKKPVQFGPPPKAPAPAAPAAPPKAAAPPPKAAAPAAPKSAAPVPAAPTAPAAPAAPAVPTEGPGGDPALLALIQETYPEAAAGPVTLTVDPLGPKANGGEILAKADTPMPTAALLKQAVADFLAAKAANAADPVQVAAAKAKQDKALADIKRLMKELSLKMSAARGELNPLVQVRVAFEKNIGAKCVAGSDGFGGGDAVLNQMITSALNMVANSEGASMVAANDVDALLNHIKTHPGMLAAFEKIGMPTTIGFAGSMGTSFRAIKAALTTGSFSQKAQHLISFGENYITKQLLDSPGKVLPAIKANLAAIQSDITAEEMQKRADALAAAKGTDGQKAAEKAVFSSDDQFKDKSAGKMDDKTPLTVIQALDRAGLFRHAAMCGAPVTKDMTNEELVTCIMETQVQVKDKVTGEKKMQDADGTTHADKSTTADAEGQTGITVNRQPYFEGIQMNMVDPKHAWIKNALLAEMPLKAGISGTTHRFLGLGGLLGVADKPGMRLVMLGHLQAIEAHSFWEICDATALGPPAGAGYLPFAPVAKESMQAAALQTIKADPLFKDVTGVQDLAAQVKRLLGS